MDGAKKLGIYTLYDRMADKFAPPFYAEGHNVAFRQYSQLLSQEGVVADDFALVWLGEYVVENAMIHPMLDKAVLALGIKVMDPPCLTSDDQWSVWISEVPFSEVSNESI